MSELKWTKELPTESGWYFLKTGCGNHPFISVREVALLNDGLNLFIDDEFIELKTFAKNGRWYTEHRWWAGPITLPTE